MSGKPDGVCAYPLCTCAPHMRCGWSFPPFSVVRYGLKYKIVEVGSDAVVRDTGIRPWRFITALRIAQALMMARHSGIHWSETPKRAVLEIFT